MKGIGLKKVKKVLHILEPEPEGEIGGVDMHLLELLKGEKQNPDFDVTIFVNQNDSYVKLLEKDNINYIYFKKQNGYLKHLKELATWIRKNDVDLIHSHGYDANYIIFLITKLFYKIRVPIIITCHGWVRTTLSLKIKTFLDILTCRMAAALTVDGQNMVQVLKKKFPKVPVEYIPNGVFSPNAEKFIDIKNLYHLGPNTKIIAAVGRLSSEKRLDVFLKCCKEILDNSDQDLAFFIVGSGPESNNLKLLAKSLGIVDKVIFTGLILDRNLLANLYHQIEFLILSSDTEGTPRVVVEAMSCSKPIIATNVGGLKELVKHDKSGYLVDKGAYLDLAKFSLRLLDDEESKFLFGRESFKIYNENYTLDIQKETINQLYKKFFNEMD